MYRVDRNNFYQNEKKATVCTPDYVSEFLFSIISPHIKKGGLFLIRLFAKAVFFCLCSARGIKPWAFVFRTKGFPIPLRKITFRMTEKHTAGIQLINHNSVSVFCLK